MSASPYRAAEAPEPPTPPDPETLLGARRSVHEPPRQRPLLVLGGSLLFLTILGAVNAAATSWEIALAVTLCIAAVVTVVIALPMIAMRGYRVEAFASGVAIVTRGQRDVVL